MVFIFKFNYIPKIIGAIDKITTEAININTINLVANFNHVL